MGCVSLTVVLNTKMECMQLFVAYRSPHDLEGRRIAKIEILQSQEVKICVD